MERRHVKSKAAPSLSVEDRPQKKGTFTLTGLLAETVLTYLFWNVFTEHIPTIWFGPMSILRATDYGEEFYYLVAYFFPFLLFNQSFRLFVQRNRWVFYGLVLLGVPSYLTSTLLGRSVLVCAGTSFGILGHFSVYWASPSRRERAVWAQLLSLFALVSSRFAFATLYPLWLTPTTTLIGLFAGLLCVPVLHADPKDEEEPVATLMDRAKKDPTAGQSAMYGAGFGILLFVTHWFCTTHGVFARWRELDPFLFGMVMIPTFFLGLFIGQDTRITRSWGWYFTAVVSAPLVLYLPSSIVWIPALFVTLYIISLWPIVTQDLATRASMPIAVAVASIVYLIGQLAVVWSVAHNFVPPGTGGPFMRERAGQVFVLAMFLIGLGYRKKNVKSFPFSMPSTQVMTVIGFIVLLITLPAVLKRAGNYGKVDGNGVQTDYVRGAVWAIRFGYNNFGWPNFRRVRDKLIESKANVIGLVETDTTRPFNGNRDVVEFLVDQMHMYYDYGPATLNETWGCALLSVFPIIRSEHGQMPSPDGEIACYIDATLDVNGVPVDVFVAHDGNTEHTRDRKQQAEMMASYAAEKKKANRKTVWLGYLTDKPGGVNYQKMVASGYEDVSPEESERYCLYLFQMGMVPSDFTRIRIDHEPEGISDTEIMLANFKTE
eukprot:TRINITY_DN1147_c0_g1_i1.p1 TRINITY_DN1147_c0_g1~~TRINITY_DN1147_c0_g1_i1.p1  ORF type:complete len:673 (-),score=139.06 TRINITY_DN1147_c0_g1_i1:162-2135(-)